MATGPDTKAGNVAAASHYDRMPPQDIDAERAVLGAMLMRPLAAGAAIEVLRGNATDLFLVPAHQSIFEAILKLFSAGKPIDRVTLMAELGENKAVENVGGDAYLTELVSAVPISANLEYYAQIVLEKALRRKLIDVCAYITAESYKGTDDVSDLLDEAEKAIFSLNEQRQINRIYSVSELVTDGVERIWNQIQSKSGITGLATGFAELDLKLSGLQPSDMIIVAARPSVGKTAFALNIAANAAQNGKSVLLFSLEMAKEQLVQRLLCMIGKVDSDRLRKGFLAKDEFPKIQDAAAKLTQMKIFIDESAGLTPLELRSKARRHASQHPLDLVIIDYMQLMHVAGKTENRQNEIAIISRSIKGLARELSIPIMTLSQLSREAEKDDRGIPKLAHLRESGAIEQDADVVIILARPPAAEREEKGNTIIVNIAKQRNGPTGRFELLFLSNIQRFENVAKVIPGSVPSAATFTHDPITEDEYEPIMSAPFDEEEEEIPFT